MNQEENFNWLVDSSLNVAPHLLGKLLVCNIDGLITGGYIVEVEAYGGEDDPASHARKGLSSRNQPMFQKAGTIYVYKSYGIHHCLNVVTGPSGEAQAILIRALEPALGIETMMMRRHSALLKQLCRGPGNLTQALSINLAQNNTKLGGVIQIQPGFNPPAQNIRATQRIGITKASSYPWRFIIAGNSFVSRSIV